MPLPLAGLLSALGIASTAKDVYDIGKAYEEGDQQRVAQLLPFAFLGLMPALKLPKLSAKALRTLAGAKADIVAGRAADVSKRVSDVLERPVDLPILPGLSPVDWAATTTQMLKGVERVGEVVRRNPYIRAIRYEDMLGRGMFNPRTGDVLIAPQRGGSGVKDTFIHETLGHGTDAYHLAQRIPYQWGAPRRLFKNDADALNAWIADVRHEGLGAPKWLAAMRDAERGLADAYREQLVPQDWLVAQRAASGKGLPLSGLELLGTELYTGTYGTGNPINPLGRIPPEALDFFQRLFPSLYAATRADEYLAVAAAQAALGKLNDEELLRLLQRFSNEYFSR